MKCYNNFDKYYIHILLGVSVVIIVAYILTIDIPELFKNAEVVFSLAYNISIGYLVTYIFYIITIKIPNSRRRVIEKKNIEWSIDSICYIGRGLVVNVFVKLAKIKRCDDIQYVEKINNKLDKARALPIEFDKDEFMEMLQYINSNDLTGTFDSNCTFENKKELNVSSAIWYAMSETQQYINLIKTNPFIDIKLLQILYEINIIIIDTEDYFFKLAEEKKGKNIFWLGEVLYKYYVCINKISVYRKKNSCV